MRLEFESMPTSPLNMTIRNLIAAVGPGWGRGDRRGAPRPTREQAGRYRGQSTEGTVKAMFVTKIKSVLALVLVFGLALGGFGLGVGHATNPVAAGEDPPLQFEQVVWVRNKAPQVPALYVLVPEVTKDLDELAKLVRRYAPAALREVDELAGPDARRRARITDNLVVVFVVPQGKADKHAVATGFSIDQLKEYTSISEEKALKTIRRHAWMFQKLPLINPGP